MNGWEIFALVFFVLVFLLIVGLGVADMVTRCMLIQGVGKGKLKLRPAIYPRNPRIVLSEEPV